MIKYNFCLSCNCKCWIGEWQSEYFRICPSDPSAACCWHYNCCLVMSLGKIFWPSQHRNMLVQQLSQQWAWKPDWLKYLLFKYQKYQDWSLHAVTKVSHQNWILTCSIVPWLSPHILSWKIPCNSVIDIQFLLWNPDSSQWNLSSWENSLPAPGKIFTKTCRQFGWLGDCSPPDDAIIAAPTLFWCYPDCCSVSVVCRLLCIVESVFIAMWWHGHNQPCITVRSQHDH